MLCVLSENDLVSETVILASEAGSVKADALEGKAAYRLKRLGRDDFTQIVIASDNRDYVRPA